MSLLAIEASTPGQGSWAVLEKDKLICQETFYGQASAALFASLEKGRRVWKNVERILVGVGPGSFSGVRVALAAAKALALVSGAEVVAARSCNAVALHWTSEERLGIFTHGRRGEYVVNVYARGQGMVLSEVFFADKLPGYLGKVSLALSTEPIEAISKCVIPSAADLAMYDFFHGREAGLALEPIHLTASPRQST